METKELLSLINVFILTGAVFVAYLQLSKTAANTRLSALAQLSAGQTAIFEMILRYDEILPIVYRKSSKEEAKKLIFLTLLINNLNLEYDQIKYRLPDKKEREAYTRHLRKEFTNPELKQRLKDTQEGYDPAFVSFVLDP